MLKACEKRYEPKRWNQRYCGAGCRARARTWQARKRQRKRREDEAVREAHRKDEKERRDRNRTAGITRPARGHAGETRYGQALCERPGCYEAPRELVRVPALYCCETCRMAVRRVRDRESKWLRRATYVGRIKRSYEYARARELRATARLAAAAGMPP